jgi:hypothetical protein
MPLFSDVYVTDSCVVLSWFNSSSKDAVKTYLYRRNDQTDWAIVDSFGIDGIAQTYTDKELTKKMMYYYTLEAVDDYGLLSGKCTPVSARVYDTGLRTALKDFKGSYNPEKRTVELKWNYHQSDGLYFVIYRSYNEGDFTVYKSVDGDERSYIDSGLVGQGTYQYAIRAMYGDGGQSPLSERISLLVQNQ